MAEPYPIFENRHYAVGEKVCIGPSPSFAYPWIVVLEAFDRVALPPDSDGNILHTVPPQYQIFYPEWNENIDYSRSGDYHLDHEFARGLWKVWYKGRLYQPSRWYNSGHKGVPPSECECAVGEIGTYYQYEYPPEFYSSQADAIKNYQLRNESHPVRAWILVGDTYDYGNPYFNSQVPIIEYEQPIANDNDIGYNWNNYFFSVSSHLSVSPVCLEDNTQDCTSDTITYTNVYPALRGAFEPEAGLGLREFEQDPVIYDDGYGGKVHGIRARTVVGGRAENIWMDNKGNLPQLDIFRGSPYLYSFEPADSRLGVPTVMFEMGASLSLYYQHASRYSTLTKVQIGESYGYPQYAYYSRSYATVGYDTPNENDCFLIGNGLYTTVSYSLLPSLHEETTSSSSTTTGSRTVNVTERDIFISTGHPFSATRPVEISGYRTVSLEAFTKVGNDDIGYHYVQTQIDQHYEKAVLGQYIPSFNNWSGPYPTTIRSGHYSRRQISESVTNEFTFYDTGYSLFPMRVKGD